MFPRHSDRVDNFPTSEGGFTKGPCKKLFLTCILKNWMYSFLILQVSKSSSDKLANFRTHSTHLTLSKILYYVYIRIYWQYVLLLPNGLFSWCANWAMSLRAFLNSTLSLVPINFGRGWIQWFIFVKISFYTQIYCLYYAITKNFSLTQTVFDFKLFLKTHSFVSPNSVYVKVKIECIHPISLI